MVEVMHISGQLSSGKWRTISISLFFICRCSIAWSAKLALLIGSRVSIDYKTWRLMSEIFAGLCSHSLTYCPSWAFLLHPIYVLPAPCMRSKSAYSNISLFSLHRRSYIVLKFGHLERFSVVDFRYIGWGFSGKRTYFNVLFCLTQWDLVVPWHCKVWFWGCLSSSLA